MERSLTETFNSIQFQIAKHYILRRGTANMDPELIVKLKTAYLELRLAQVCRGLTMSEEDVICEGRVTEHLGNLSRIWAKQSEKFYDDHYPSGDSPPPPADGGEGGPVPTE